MLRQPVEVLRQRTIQRQRLILAELQRIKQVMLHLQVTPLPRPFLQTQRILPVELRRLIQATLRQLADLLQPLIRLIIIR